jgi:hypothetical protein
MIAVRTILVRIKTERQGSDGIVYLGIGGTEFMIDSNDPDIDDFEPFSDRTYWMGEKPVILPSGSQENYGNPDYNNPLRPYQIFTENLDKFPVYIRFNEIDDSIFGEVLGWRIRRIEVRVNPVERTEDRLYIDPGRSGEIFNLYHLSRKRWGKFVFLRLLHG